MTVHLSRRYGFFAAHRLHAPTLSDAENRSLYGKCNNPYGHGHNYVLEVSARGPLDSVTGRAVDPAALDRLVTRVAETLTPDGVLVLCHWRHRVDGWVMDAERVHAAFEDRRMPPLQATYRDRDVELRVHSAAWPPYDE